MSSEDKYILVETSEKLNTVIEILRNKKFIAVDTEFVKINTLYPIVALVQLYDGDKAYLIDPITLSNSDMKLFWQEFIGSDATFIFFAMHEDLQLINYYAGSIPKKIADIQIMQAYFGGNFHSGLSKVVKEFVDIELLKDQTLSVWMNRPLSKEQLRYGAEDVLYLIDIYNIFLQKITDSGNIEYYESDMKMFAEQCITKPNLKYEYLKNIGSDMTLVQRAKVRELVNYRVTKSEELDVAASLIIPKKCIPSLVTTKYVNSNETLARIGMHWKSIRLYGKDILKILNNRNIDMKDLFSGSLFINPKLEFLVSSISEIYKDFANSHSLAIDIVYTKKNIGELLLYLSTEKSMRDLLPIPYILQSTWRYQLIMDLIEKYE